MEMTTIDYVRAIDDEVFNYFDYLLKLAKSGDEAEYTPLNSDVFADLVANDRLPSGVYKILTK